MGGNFNAGLSACILSTYANLDARRTGGALLIASLTGELSHLSFAQYVPPTTMPDEHPEKDEEAKAGHLINELFVGEKIYIQDKGEWNLVVTPSFTQGNDAKEKGLSAELKYGVTDQINLSFEVPAVVVNPDEGSQHVGLGDISLGISYDFIQSENFPRRRRFSLPTGDEDRDLGGGQFVWEPSIVSAFKLGQGESTPPSAERSETIIDDEVTYSVAGAYRSIRSSACSSLAGRPPTTIRNCTWSRDCSGIQMNRWNSVSACRSG